MPSRMTTEELIEQIQQRDAVIEQLKALIEQLKAAGAELSETVRKLSGELEWCKRQLFGRKSERYEDPNQGRLFNNNMASEAEEAQHADHARQIVVHRRLPAAGGRGKRQPIPDHLRREQIVHKLPEAQRIDPVTGEPRLKKIGQEISERLAFKPGEVYVEQHIRYKYRRLGHENLSGAEPEIITAPLSCAGLPKCLAAPSLLAEIAVRKYGDHLPLHRLVKIFRRHQVELRKPSMCRWMQGVGELFQPLLSLMKQRLLEHSRVIQHDDTPVRQQEGGRGPTKQCHFWTTVGQPGTFGHYILFDYTQSRAASGPEQWFRDTNKQPLFVGGALQCDAFAGYNGLLDPEGDWGMVHIGCWAHARRKFHDARTSAPGQACQALAMIRRLYDIEAAARDGPDEQRLEARQREAKPIVDKFFEWCRQERTTALPQSRIGEAFTYALNLEESLRRYLEAGHLQIDNNACERSLRGIAIGRKNWLFTGSPAGGLAAARLFSVIASAQLHGVEPLSYVRDLIERLPAAPPSELDEFLPNVWAAQHPRS